MFRRKKNHCLATKTTIVKKKNFSYKWSIPSFINETFIFNQSWIKMIIFSYIYTSSQLKIFKIFQTIYKFMILDLLNIAHSNRLLLIALNEGTLEIC